MNITKRCVHPQERTILEAMERVRGEVKSWHTSGHADELPEVVPTTAISLPTDSLAF
jgi:hypothetical protein